ncbi:MAG: hypothetical protein WCE80_09120 [Acidimicrobiia bacterium]
MTNSPASEGQAFRAPEPFDAGTSGHGHQLARRAVTLTLEFFALVTLLVMVAPLSAMAGISAPVAQVSPYQSPPLTGGDGPSWFSPSSVFSQLPLWAQAAAVSAAVTISFFALTAVVRWTWRYVSDLRSRAT